MDCDGGGEWAKGAARTQIGPSLALLCRNGSTAVIALLSHQLPIITPGSNSAIQRWFLPVWSWEDEDVTVLSGKKQRGGTCKQSVLKVRDLVSPYKTSRPTWQAFSASGEKRQSTVQLYIHSVGGYDRNSKHECRCKIYVNASIFVNMKYHQLAIWGGIWRDATPPC